MIVLDTNVISEPLKPAPDKHVLNWLDDQVAETLCTTAVNYSEVLAGVACLPDGRRKRDLILDIQRTIQALFAQRILPFDVEAAVEYAQIEALTHKIGMTLSVADQQIAAIAKLRGHSVATRDVDPFRAAGLTVINPWE
ncbi:MAG: type II toxin-antitoxin system VapC family toxin [Terracidiphilus sp.]